MKYENIISLQKDLDRLIEKHGVLIKNGDYNSALNIMKNIDILTGQLRKLDYQTMVSKFTTSDGGRPSGDEKQLISIWKQNAFGDIRDVETYYLGDRYMENTYDFLNKLSISWNTMTDEMKENVYRLVGVRDNIKN